MAKNMNPTNHLRAPDGAAFPLPSVGRVPVKTAAPTPIRPSARHDTKSIAPAHGRDAGFDGATKRPSDCGASPVQSAAEPPFDVRSNVPADAS